jgi:hypothetical protein
MESAQIGGGSQSTSDDILIARNQQNVELAPKADFLTSKLVFKKVL